MNGATPAPTASAASSNTELPISVAHGGGENGNVEHNVVPRTEWSPGGSSGPTASEKPDLATPELDAKIAKAEARAKAANASAADKKAAADAYLERGNIYYNAGNPRLYKFALGDFRRVLRYQPDNTEAREKIDQMVQIYQSMGRPVPPNGTEP